jgi:hypothetical protein
MSSILKEGAIRPLRSVALLRGDIECRVECKERGWKKKAKEHAE